MIHITHYLSTVLHSTPLAKFSLFITLFLLFQHMLPDYFTLLLFSLRISTAIALDVRWLGLCLPSFSSPASGQHLPACSSRAQPYCLRSEDKGDPTAHPSSFSCDHPHFGSLRDQISFSCKVFQFRF